MKKLIISSTIFLTLLGPAFVSAQGAIPTGSGSGSMPTGQTNNTQGNGSAKVNITIKNPFSIGDNLYKILEAIVDKVLIPIGGTLCVLAFIYAGFKYVIAQGKPKEIEEANRTLLYAAIGTAVLLGAWTITKVINSTLDSIINNT